MFAYAIIIKVLDSFEFLSPLIGSSLTRRFIRFSFGFELSFRNQLASLSYFRGGPESSQIATNTREILFNGAGGQTLVYHSDVVNMHDTRCVSFMGQPFMVWLKPMIL